MTMTEHNNNIILIEIGTYLSRIGFVGEENPRYIYRTEYLNIKDQYIQIFSEKLKINPSEYQVVIIKDTGTELKVLKKEAELLFNDFKIKGIAFMNAQTGIIFSWSHGYNGIVIDIGYRSTILTPINKGNPINDLCVFSNTAGNSIEEYIIKDLIKNGINIDYINRYKEKIINYLMKLYYFFDCQEDDFEYQEIQKRKKNIESVLKIKDPIGGLLKINLPNPVLSYNLLKNSKDSAEPSLNYCVIEVINNSLTKTLETIKNEKYGRIIFCGGGSQVLGLRSFLIRELFNATEFQKYNKKDKLYEYTSGSSIIRANFRNYDIDLRIVPSEYYSSSSWLGGSIIFSMKYAKGFFTTRQHYNDYKGKSIGFIDKKLEVALIEITSNSNDYHF